MKPVHIVTLVLAGALGGAMIMKVAHSMRPASRVTTVAQAPAESLPVQPPLTVPAAVPASQPEPPVQAAAPAQQPLPETTAVLEKTKPSPMPLPVRREAARPQRSRPVAPLVAAPVALARAGTPPSSDPVLVPGLSQVAAAPSAPSPAMAPPSASTEPEHVTPQIPQSSVAPAPQPHQVTLNAGLLLPVRLVDGLSSERNVPGDVFLATLDKELVVDGFVIAERGARMEGRVVAADRGGKATGVAALALELTRLHTSDGQAVPIETENFFKHADVNHSNQGAIIGGGAIIGAAIGAIAAGGKGAAIGAGVGGGAGAGDVLLARRKPAEMASETHVTFRLKSTVPLTEQLR